MSSAWQEEVGSWQHHQVANNLSKIGYYQTAQFSVPSFHIVYPKVYSNVKRKSQKLVSFESHVNEDEGKMLFNHISLMVRWMHFIPVNGIVTNCRKCQTANVAQHSARTIFRIRFFVSLVIEINLGQNLQLWGNAVTKFCSFEDYMENSWL